MNRFRALIALILLAAVSGGPALAQEKMVLTLEDCLKLALAQNPFYLAARAKEDQAEASLKEAVAGFFPTLNASGTDVLDKKVFTIEFPSFIPGGSPTRVKMDFTRAYTFALSFSLPLYSGGRLVAGYKTANYNLEATREAIRQSREEMVLNVKKSFYGYLLARSFVGVAEEGVALAEKHYTNVKNLAEVGMASKFDLLRSEVQLANLKPQLIRARNALATAEIGLKMQLGLDLQKSVEFKGELAFRDVEADVDQNIVMALARRPEINQLNYQKLMAAEMIKLNKGAGLPSLAVGGAYNYWSDHLNLKKENWESYYQINLVLNIPIFNGFGNAAKVAQSKAAFRQLEYSQKGLIDSVKFEVQEAVLALRQARESLFSQEKNVEQAQEAVRIADLNYAEGLATNLDVSSAQVALSQAKTNHVQALYDYAVALAQIEKSMGTGSDRYEE
ncbi:MAG: TolC family protein [Acidobacteriota bacterium]|jgi:outer membrane protein TolC|nr:TolC family protein [Acidobacteriota bacterium]HNQ80129.1 TolC family protein [Candidatus Aminicenantes bacterium]MDD8028638.1 TolC family protein [Acidobacteriota bacterium]MDD8032820.1 TolC family protein [Acidobacteriota bacterium]MDD8039005.1 TolC family protein [Acidobacteriota bacterium]